MKGEWVDVEGASAHRIILYFHGGGFIAGSPETVRRDRRVIEAYLGKSADAAM